MKHRNSTPAQTPEMLLNELRSLVAKAEEMMGESIDTEGADNAGESLRETVEGARERLGDLYLNARKRVVAGAKSTDASIRAHPYQSLGIALGAGLLLGLFISRRSQRGEAS